MNKPMFFHVLTATALMWCVPLGASAQEACEGEVHGVVVERFEGVEETLGVFEAVIEVLEGDAGVKVVRRAKTDPNGAYEMKGMCRGGYRIRVRAKGYEPLEERVVLPEGGVVEVEHTVELLEDAPLPNKVVTSTQEEGEQILATETLRGRALDRTRGEDLGTALKTLPGVDAIETGTVSKPVIHGMHSNRVSILQDGLKLEAQSWGLDHAPEVDAASAQRLTVVKGAAGVRYGSGAIGGVILVESAPLPVGKGVGAEVFATGVSNGGQGVVGGAVGSGVDLVEGLAWQVAGNVKNSGALSTPEFVLDNTGVEESNVSAEVGVHRPTWGVGLRGTRFDAKKGVFTGLVSGNINDLEGTLARGRPANVDLYTFEYEVERPYQDVSHTTIVGKGYVVAGEAGRLEAQVSHQRNDRKEYDLVRANITGPQLDFLLRTTALEAVWTSLGSATWFWSVGTSASLQDNVYKGRRLIPNYRAFSGALFGWVTYVHSPEFEVEVGSRVDLTQMRAYQRDAVGGAAAAVEEENFFFAMPSAVAGVKKRWGRGLVTTGNVSSAGRAPTVNELFLDGVTQGSAGFLRGDSSLDPEQTYGVSTTVSWEHDLAGAEVTPYAQWIDGYIVDRPQVDDEGRPLVRQTVSGGFPSFVTTQTSARFFGADASLRLKLASWVELGTKATWVRARDLSRQDDLVFIPPDTYRGSVTLMRERLGALSGLAWRTEVVRTQEQTRVDPLADFAPPPPGFTLIHSSVDMEIGGESWGHWVVGAGVKNLGDMTYRNYLSRQRYFAPEPGRSWSVRVKTTF